MNEIKAGAAVNYLNLIVRIGIGFLLSPFILYHLGVGEYGVYTIAGAIVGWLAMAAVWSSCRGFKKTITSI